MDDDEYDNEIEEYIEDELSDLEKEEKLYWESIEKEEQDNAIAEYGIPISKRNKKHSIYDLD